FWTVAASNNVSIAHGAATGVMPADPYEALTTTVLQDGDVNRALDAGSSINVVALGTTTLRGDLNIDGSAGAVAINRSVGSAPLTVMLSAKNRVIGNNFS
ncbi:hypothetical protein AB4084_35805, partial [Lysobacter sp. 2RAB21]